MHKVTLSKRFEQEVVSGGFSSQQDLDNLKQDLKAHLDASRQGDVAVQYLGKTDSFDYPQAVEDADLWKIHVFDPACPKFNAVEQAKWNSAKNLRGRTSDTYFVYTRNYFDRYSCHFLGVLNPAHTKGNFGKSGMIYFGPLIDEANKFNGM